MMIIKNKGEAYSSIMSLIYLFWYKDLQLNRYSTTGTASICQLVIVYMHLWYKEGSFMWVDFYWVLMLCDVIQLKLGSVNRWEGKDKEENKIK